MSIVGPRPETPRWVARFPTEFGELLERRPGLIDPASLHFRDEEAILAASGDPETCYAEDVLPQKLAMSLEFHQHRSVRNDVRFLCSAARELTRPVR